MADVVRRQRDVGIDVINEGEYTKGGDWLSFTDDRFSGFTAAERPDGIPLILQGKDREEFADFYRHAAAHGTLFFEPGEQIKKTRPFSICEGPIAYSGQNALDREIQLLKQAGENAGLRICF